MKHVAQIGPRMVRDFLLETDEICQEIKSVTAYRVNSVVDAGNLSMRTCASPQWYPVRQAEPRHPHERRSTRREGSGGESPE